MFENSIRLATCDSGLESTDNIWMQAQQAKLLLVVAGPTVSLISLWLTPVKLAKKVNGVLMLRRTLYVRKKHQLASLILLLAKENNFKGQLIKRGMKRPEVNCFHHHPPFSLLCKYELIYLLKQQIRNCTQSAITNGVKEATGSKVICPRPCSLSPTWLTSSEPSSALGSPNLQPHCSPPITVEQIPRSS